jgi:outer membrane immunogenic protein
MAPTLSASRILAGCLAITALAEACTADAADMTPVFKAPPAAVAPAYNWTGFYLGAHAGYAWADKQYFLPAGADLDGATAEGGIVGAQAGFNWQTGRWVLGAEVQASWSHLRKGVPYVEPSNIRFFTDLSGLVNNVRIGTTVENLGSVAGRLGYAWDRLLVYGKGGGAWADDLYRTFNRDLPGEPLLASARDTRWGWMVGAGLEYGLTANWSAKIEFDYFDFGKDRITVVSVPGVTPPTRDFDVEQTMALIKAGINFRFGGM